MDDVLEGAAASFGAINGLLAASALTCWGLSFDVCQYLCIFKLYSIVNFSAPLRLLVIFVSPAQDLSIPEKPKGAILGHLHSISFCIILGSWYFAQVCSNNCVDTRMLSVSCNSTSQRAIAQSQGQSSCYAIGTVMIWQWYGICHTRSYYGFLWYCNWCLNNWECSGDRQLAWLESRIAGIWT